MGKQGNDTQGKRWTGLRAALAGALVLALAAVPAAADNRSFGVLVGSGYASFTTGGAPGDNLYWISAIGAPGKGRDRGLWYADVFINFPGGAFDFEALYEVDCINVDRQLRQAWIDGTIIESNNPARIGRRATLWLKDGGPGGEDQHAITALPASGGPTCDDRPEPAFRETVQSGDYRIY